MSWNIPWGSHRRLLEEGTLHPLLVHVAFSSAKSKAWLCSFIQVVICLSNSHVMNRSNARDLPVPLGFFESILNLLLVDLTYFTNKISNFGGIILYCELRVCK